MLFLFHQGDTQQTDEHDSATEESDRDNRTKDPMCGQYPTKQASCREKGGNNLNRF